MTDNKYREGSLEAPTRHPVKWKDADYYNEESLFKELQRVGNSMTLTHARAHYLLSLAAFSASFSMKSPGLHEFLLDRLHPVDRAILDRVPFLSRWAWRGSVTFVRPA